LEKKRNERKRRSADKPGPVLEVKGKAIKKKLPISMGHPPEKSQQNTDQKKSVASLREEG